MSFRHLLRKASPAILNNLLEKASPGNPVQAASKQVTSAGNRFQGGLHSLSRLKRDSVAQSLRHPSPSRPPFTAARPANTAGLAESFKHSASQNNIPSKNIADVSFHGQATQISRHNALRFTQLRLKILQQPAGQASHDEKTMHGILSSKDIGERDRLLLQNERYSQRYSTVSFNGVTAEVSKDAELKLMYLRNNLLNLAPETAQSYKQLLSDVLASDDIDQRHRLVDEMGKQVEQHLKKFATVEFKGVTTEIPKTMELEFMQMRIDLVKLPYERGEEYGRLLQDVLASKLAGGREELLGAIARQVAQETKGLPEIAS